MRGGADDIKWPQTQYWSFRVRDKHLESRDVDAGDQVMRRWPSTGTSACPLKLRPLSPPAGMRFGKGSITSRANVASGLNLAGK